MRLVLGVAVLVWAACGEGSTAVRTDGGDLAVPVDAAVADAPSVELGRADFATLDGPRADLATADLASADLAAADLVTADLATADLASSPDLSGAAVGAPCVNHGDCAVGFCLMPPSFPSGYCASPCLAGNVCREPDASCRTLATST